jgi:hypothetical protein
VKKAMNADRWSITITVVLVLGLCVLVVPVCFSAAQDSKIRQEHYGLIFGTAYGPDDRPLYGVRVTIHPVGKKHPNWELFSDHRGEFAQRVPPVPADYAISGQIEVAPLENGKPQVSKKKRLRGETKVHIENEERYDFSLHLKEQQH